MANPLPETGPQLVYSPDQLLASRDYAEPLIANGVRCHGGFDPDGHYQSPRTLHRGPAISAWQARLRAEEASLIEIPQALMPPQFPNLEQAKLLLRNGVRDPIVRTLTVISIVEGFGAIIRDVAVPDLASLIVEPLEGRALAHLDSGLFEAHARDESGWESEGGHKQMWEAARDLALEDPEIPGDVLMSMMARRRGRARERSFPELDRKLERLLEMMAQVLVVEVFAEGTFQWGMELLSDPELSAEPERAGQMIAYIRADESPHVEYLRTALSELRACTLRGVDGETIAGREIVDRCLHGILHRIGHTRPREQREDLRESLVAAMQVAPNPGALLEEFDALETSWTAPERTGFEAREAVEA